MGLARMSRTQCQCSLTEHCQHSRRKMFLAAATAATTAPAATEVAILAIARPPPLVPQVTRLGT